MPGEHTHPVDVGELVLLHDPSDRPPEARNGQQGRFRGYHWSIWKRLDRGYHIVVDWAGRLDPPTKISLIATLDSKFLAVETHQPTVKALEMAAIHMKDDQWHAMLDRKYPWDQVDAMPRELHR